MVCLEDEITRLKLRKAKSYWDFIKVRLYDHPDKYEVKDEPFWIWSPREKRLDERSMYADICGDRTLVRTWHSMKEYVENELIYIKDEKRKA